MIYIGIDPDIEASGVAFWKPDFNEFDYIKNMSFWDVIDVLKDCSFQKTISDFNFTVIIEAGWLISKSNWHGRTYQSKSVGEKIAKNVGSNHQIGILIAEYCDRYGITYELKKPLGKVKSDYFKKITGYTKRTNQDQRDAAMLVYGLKK
jgi:hypothetical protein